MLREWQKSPVARQLSRAFTDITIRYIQQRLVGGAVQTPFQRNAELPKATHTMQVLASVVFNGKVPRGSWHRVEDRTLLDVANAVGTRTRLVIPYAAMGT